MSETAFNDLFNQAIVHRDKAKELPVVMSIVVLPTKQLGVYMTPETILQLVDLKDDEDYDDARKGSRNRETLATILEETATMLRTSTVNEELSRSVADV